MKRIVSGILIALLSIGMVTLAFNVQFVKASSGICIKADGSVDPPTAPIQRVGDLYTFTDDIWTPIMVQRSNIIIDGNGYALRGSGYDFAFWLSGVNGVTIKKTNVLIDDGKWGILLVSSSFNFVFDNNIGSPLVSPSENGITLAQGSSNNWISRNKITNNVRGILLDFQYNNNNMIYGNVIKDNCVGILLYLSSNNYNIIYGNNITNNDYGVYFYSSNNKIYHNNFMDNNLQAYDYDLLNVWDDAYPSGGNYWSDYIGTDNYSGVYQNVTGNDGIGDSPYSIGLGPDMDRYPLMRPWVFSPQEAVKGLIRDVKSMNLHQGIDNSLDAKLNAVLQSLEALNAKQRNDAVAKLQSFVNEVEAQKGNKLTVGQADYLISEAQRIIDLIEG